jgi:hypothetical protein
VLKQQAAYLKKSGEDPFDSLANKRWHRKFNIELVEDIPLESFPARPVMNVQASLKPFYDIGHEKILGLIDRVKRSHQKDCFSDSEENKLLVNLNGESRLIAILREKDRLNSLQMDKLAQKPFSNRVPEMQWLAKAIRMLYANKKVSSIFLSQVVTHLMKKSTDKLYSMEELDLMIRGLVDILPQWLSLVDNHEGPILRISKTGLVDRLDEVIGKHFAN